MDHNGVNSFVHMVVGKQAADVKIRLLHWKPANIVSTNTHSWNTGNTNNPLTNNSYIFMISYSKYTKKEQAVYIPINSYKVLLNFTWEYLSQVASRKLLGTQTQSTNLLILRLFTKTPDHYFQFPSLHLGLIPGITWERSHNKDKNLKTRRGRTLPSYSPILNWPLVSRCSPLTIASPAMCHN